MRSFFWALALSAALSLSACGGGGSSNNSSSQSSGSGSGSSAGNGASNNAANPASNPTGGSNPPPSNTNSLAADASAAPVSWQGASNAIPVQVSSASNFINFPLVSVTICTPGSNASSGCTTIPNVLLDTESFGLRLFASAVPSTTLQTLTHATTSSGGANVDECATFGSGNAWGSVRLADIKMAGEVAPSVPVQIIADTVVSQPPSECSGYGVLDQPSALGANGILGIGVALNDCGSACATKTANGSYYGDGTVAATPATVAIANQVTNPVTRFAFDNNGVIVEMAQVSDQGAPSATGTLVFGIDTQANNALAGTNATLIHTDSTGDFRARYNGGASVNAFMDSGSNSLNFQDSTLPQNLHSFYLPSTTISRTAVLTNNSGGEQTSVAFNIANATALFTAVNYAFNDLAAYLPLTVDFGIPFFYGRHVYYVIGNGTTPGGVTGPAVAYVSQ